MSHDEFIAHDDVVFGGDPLEEVRFSCPTGWLSVHASVGYHLGVDVEATAVDVEQGFLGGNQLIARLNFLQSNFATALLPTRSSYPKDRHQQASRNQYR